MDITELLNAAGRGDRDALERLYSSVYEELHRIAEAERRRWSGNDTLNVTDVLHEACLRLLGQREPGWEGRGHFFSAAARAMRHILVDYAKRQQAQKRGGGARPVTLDGHALVAPQDAEQLLALHSALERLEAHHPRRSRVVECRFFAGLPVEATAEALGISPATVKREWALARVWLYEEMEVGGGS
jgi:RNA polymerase sigma factor (TIGR02999 family)